MGYFFDRYTREPKKELDLDAPPKQGFALFFDVLKRELWELVKLNLVFILFCLPLITIPAALAAMSKVVMLMFMDRPIYVFSEFFTSFRAEWKRATIAGLIFSLLLAVTLFGQFIYAYIMENFFLQSFAMLVCVVFITAGFYLFPMLAMLDIGLRGAFKNALLLVFLRMPQNILTLLAVAILMSCALIFFPASILLALLILFSLANFITTFCAYTGLKKYVLKDKP